MVKPICVIYFPTDYTVFSAGKLIDTLKLMEELNGWDEGKKYVPDADRFGGYMYWCFTKDNITEPQFEVFHPNKFTKANYEELKKLVMDNLRKPNSNDDVPY